MNSQHTSVDVLSKLQSFNSEYPLYVSVKTPESKSFSAFIRKKLDQFGLDSTQADDIKAEVYIRGQDAILAGKDLFNLQGWIRSCAYNVIRERKRSQRKYLELNQNIDGINDDIANTDDSCTSEEQRAHDYQRLKKALNSLSEWEQKLITLKEIENRSWDDIHKTLLLETGYHYSIPSLRQQKARAIKKLRDILDKKNE